MEFAMKRMNRNLLLAGVCLTGLFLMTPRVAGQSGVYVLSDTGDAQFSGTVNVLTSTIYINSTDAEAFNVFGDAEVKAAEANVVGGTANPENFIGTLNSGVAATLDPLATLPTPTWDPGADLGTVDAYGGSLRLGPGFYSGGLTFGGSVNVWLEPGVYILDGIGLNVGANANVRGLGVTLFITGEGSVSLTGVGVVDLSPSFGGVYDDVLLFVDRDIEPGAGSVTLVGGSDFRVNGKIYAPASLVDITGNSGLDGDPRLDPRFGFLLICDTLRLGGTGAINFIRLPSPEECFD